MTGFDYEIDREKGLIKVVYRSDIKDIFGGKNTKECIDILIEVLQNISPIIEMAKEIKMGNFEEVFCPHGTMGGRGHCMACLPELKDKEIAGGKSIYKLCKECLNFQIVIEDEGNPYPDCKKEEYLTKKDLDFSETCSQFKPKTKIKFICGGCKNEFESYHDGIGLNTGFCPKCLDIHETIGLEGKPE